MHQRSKLILLPSANLYCIWWNCASIASEGADGAQSHLPPYMWGRCVHLIKRFVEKDTNIIILFICPGSYAMVDIDVYVCMGFHIINSNLHYCCPAPRGQSGTRIL